MNNEYKCPASEHLLAWMDGEQEDELTARHISGCPACQEFIGAMHKENEMLQTMIESIPTPDLTGQITAGIKEAARSTGSLFKIISYLVTAGVGFILILAYSILPGLINFELRPVLVVRILTGVDRLVVFIDETLKFISAEIFPGDPLIPPVILVLLVLLINLIGKRRLSDV